MKFNVEHFSTKIVFYHSEITCMTMFGIEIEFSEAFIYAIPYIHFSPLFVRYLFHARHFYMLIWTL